MSSERSSSPSAWSRPWLAVLGFAAIAATAWFVYAPALHGSFLWDDRADIVENPLLRDVTGLKKIWIEPTLLFDFYPLKYSVQWIQWQLWHDQTLGYHLTNVGLHVLSGLLFWRLLRQLGVRHGWLGGLLFVVHPVAVESVAWIAELKNTLSLPLLLLAFSAFIDFCESGRRADYIRSVLWFLAKMLCKTSAVMTPFVLLLLLWWRNRKLSRRDVLLVSPFFFVSLALGLITLWFQTHRGIAQETFSMGGPLARLALISSSQWHYLLLCIWPATPLPIYPQWQINPPSATLFLFWVGLLPALGWMWTKRSTWGRHALLGVGWFLLYLAPFTGVTTISYMRFSWVMDHIVYLPVLGVLGLGVAAVDTAEARFRGAWRIAPVGAGLAIAIVLGGLARRSAANFESEEVLWAYTVTHNPNAWLAHNNLGALLAAKGEYIAARVHIETALRLRPDYADAHKNLGDLLHTTGDFAGARKHYERALSIKPDFVWAHVALGEMLRAEGHVNEALSHLLSAAHLDPENADVFNFSGLAFRDLNEVQHAIDNFEQALRCRPNFPEAHINLGSMLRRAGHTDEAIKHFEAALQMRPRSHEVRYNLGNALQSLGRHEDAVLAYEQALRLKPDLAVAHYNLAVSLAQLGRAAEARLQYEEARQIDSMLPELRF